MRAFLISDNIETEVGMRLAGIESVVVHDRDSVLKELKTISSDKEIGIILVTEKIASMVRDDIDRMKLSMKIPLIVEVPDRHGTTLGKDRITRYVKEAIGLKI